MADGDLGRISTARHRVHNPDAYVSGARKAVALVKRLDDDEALAEAASLVPEHRRCAPQRNVVWESVASLIAAGDMRAVEGFCAVLTDHLGVAALGCVPDSDYLGGRVDVVAALADPMAAEFVRRLGARP